MSEENATVESWPDPSTIDIEREADAQFLADLKRCHLEIEEMRERHRVACNKHNEQMNDLHLRNASLEKYIDQLLRIIRGLVSLTLAITGRRD